PRQHLRPPAHRRLPALLAQLAVSGPGPREESRAGFLWPTGHAGGVCGAPREPRISGLHYQRGPLSMTEATESRPAPDTPSGFFGRLFDFSFEEFITLSIIKILYVLFVIAAGLAALGI